VALVGVRIERNDPEKHHQWLAELVGRVDGCVERGIVRRALRALHPIDDRPALRIDGRSVSPRRPRLAPEAARKGVVNHGWSMANEPIVIRPLQYPS
jgi:hypothetical protein